MVYLIADNQPITAFGLQQLFVVDVADQVVVVNNKSDMIRELRLYEYEHKVILLDYALFDFNSVDDLLVVHSRFINIHWILFSDELVLSFLYRLVNNEKSFSAIYKHESVADISKAIDLAKARTKYISRRILIEIEQYKIFRTTVCEKEQLTRSEEEILKLLAQGFSSKEIADRRNSSIHTITSHRKNIFRKIQVNTVFEATKYAMRAGLVDGADYYI